jgi:hypothetical protein
MLSDNSAIIGFGKLRQNKIAFVSSELNKCLLCKERKTCNIRFKYNNVFVFMEPRSHFKIQELPKDFELDGKNYLLLCLILHFNRNKHFVSVFSIGGENYLVDYLKSAESIKLDFKKH